ASKTQGVADILRADIVGRPVPCDVELGARSIKGACDHHIAVASHRHSIGGAPVLEEGYSRVEPTSWWAEIHGALAGNAHRPATVVVNHYSVAGQGSLSGVREAAALDVINARIHRDACLALNVDPTNVKAGVDRDGLLAGDLEGATTLQRPRGRRWEILER